MRTDLITFLALCVFAQCAPRAVSQPPMTTVFIVRHAEKLDAADPDSPLSADGHTRARDLAQAMKGEGVQRIYATTKLRTQQTAAPLAQTLGIVPVVLDPYALEDLMVSIRTSDQGKAVLVVGHSNTIPTIVTRLSGHGIEGIPEDTYDRLFKVTIAQDGATSLQQLHYGTPSPHGSEDALPTEKR